MDDSAILHTIVCEKGRYCSIAHCCSVKMMILQYYSLLFDQKRKWVSPELQDVMTSMTLGMSWRCSNSAVQDRPALLDMQEHKHFSFDCVKIQRLSQRLGTPPVDLLLDHVLHIQHRLGLYLTAWSSLSDYFKHLRESLSFLPAWLSPSRLFRPFTWIIFILPCMAISILFFDSIESL